MLKIKEKETKIERVTLKLPKKWADYFRQTFPHGKRSQFVVECLKRFKRDQEVASLEEELRDIGKERQ